MPAAGVFPWLLSIWQPPELRQKVVRAKRWQ